MHKKKASNDIGFWVVEQEHAHVLRPDSGTCQATYEHVAREKLCTN